LGNIRRRGFITLLGGAVTVWPLAAWAQQRPMPVVGFLASASAATSAHFVAAFRQGLAESGYVESRNVTVEYRWAENQYDRLPALAADLVRRQVALIVASGGPASPLAAKAATSTIPIVFTATSDPVELGLVASLNRPGGNVTGTSAFTTELDAKRLEVIRELVSAAGVIGALINPNRPDAEAQVRDVQRAARTIGQRVILVYAGSERDLETAFASMVRERISALLVGADPFFSSLRTQVVALAARHALPAVYMSRDFVAAGGLASYGTTISEGYRQAGVYAGQILNGAQPAELPVVQPTKFELAINLKTAKALGLDVSPMLLARADEVIE
jgi:putative tryptophan/tyrosine transport system substrate-binding protein